MYYTVFHPKCVDVWLQKWNRTCPLCKSAIKRQGKPLFTEDPESSRLLTDSGAPSPEGDDERDGPGSSAPHGATGGASNYGALEHTSPLRLMAAERHKRSASNTSSSSQRSGSRHTRRGSSKHDTTATTTIELNVTSSGETSRSVSHSPSPSSSLLPFHTPHQSDDDGADDDGGGGDGDTSETTPSFKTANEENSVTLSVRV